jgi:hypothetical protein
MSLVHPHVDEVHNKVDQAIAQLLEKDTYLLEIDANERAISHRLGLYLQLLFKEWHVDCEYNRNLDNPKRLKTYKKFFDEYQRVWNIAETDPVTVFPDIIIHERGTRNNLLIVEIKKTTSRISCEFDYFKLREFKYQYGYIHALFLKLITGCKDIGIDTKEYLPDQTIE